MHKNHVGDGPSPTEQRRKMSGPMSPGQRRFIETLLDDINERIVDEFGSVTFQQADTLIAALKKARHGLTHATEPHPGVEMAAAILGWKDDN